MPRLWIVVGFVTLIACNKKEPPSTPVVGTPAANETVNGTERVGWDQPAADAVDLAAIGYVVYVDGLRTDLAGVTCASAAAAAGFPCAARLPAMSSGSHTLELASFVNDGGVLESARSAPLRVTLVAQEASGAQNVRTAAANMDQGGANMEALGDGMNARAHLVADGLDSPTALAVAPDGRLFVAERAGRIRIIRGGHLVNEPAISLADTLGANGQLLALALDPQFERTRYAFAIYTAPSHSGDRAGEPMFTLARFREVSDTLGDRAVLLDEVPASAPSPSAALRFGPDGKLYAAFDDGGDARRRGDAASLNGKVLRLNPDGTTPDDASGATPVYADGYRSPTALDWDPQTATLWTADRAAGGSPFAFYRGALFPAWSGRLLTGIVAIGPDGAIYYGTRVGIGRLVPARAR